MKKIARFGISNIVYNDKYVCASGNKIVVYDRDTMEEYHTFSNIKNVTGLEFNNKFVFSKNTSGVYFFFDLIEKTLICRSKHPRLMNASHDGRFFLSNEENCIVDLLELKDENYYLIKFYTETKRYEEIKLQGRPFHKNGFIYDDKQKKAYVLFTEMNYMNKPETKTKLFIVDTNLMQIEDEISSAYPHEMLPRDLFDKHKILSRDNDVYDVTTGEKESLDALKAVSSEKNGYFVELLLQGNGRVAFIYSEKIFIYNIQSKTIENTFELEYCSCARIMDDTIFIGTWNGLFQFSKNDVKPDDNSLIDR